MVTTTTAVTRWDDEPADEFPLVGQFQAAWGELLSRLEASASLRFEARPLTFVVTNAVRLATGLLVNRCQITAPQGNATVEHEPARCVIFEANVATTESCPPLAPPSSTAHATSDDAQEEAFRELLETLSEKWAENDTDAMRNALRDFLARCGPSGVVTLAVAADQDRIGKLLFVDILDLLESLRPPELRSALVWMMRKFLTHPSHAVRYAAMSGLLSLEDREAIPLLRAVAADEHISEELRREIVRGVEYLQAI